MADIFPGGNGALDFASSFTSPFAVLNDMLIFAADDPIHGLELWRSHDAETSMVANIARELGRTQDAIRRLAGRALKRLAAEFGHPSDVISGA